MRSSRVLLCAATAAVACLTFTASSGDPASARPSSFTSTPVTSLQRTYTADPNPVADPGRGFYRYTATHLSTEVAYTPLDAAGLAQDRVRNGTTLAYRVFYLDRYAGTDVLASSDLALIGADLAAARAAGVKLVVRFAYSEATDEDAPVARVLQHIRQLGPVLKSGADVLAAVQAGFIGRWGEWYYTQNFAADPAVPWQLSDEDWAARGAVLTTLLDTVPAQVPLQVRYPQIKQRLLPDVTDPRAARVGVHDDCFLAGEDDYGTFRSDQDRTWLTEQTRKVLMGGETCAVNAPRSEWPSASSELARYHVTYLNMDYHPEVLASWGTEGRSEAARRLGYRLRLTSATLPAGAAVGQSMRVRVSLTNDGYAAPVQNRPVRLVLRGAATVRAVSVPVDVRTWAPGTVVNLDVPVTAPTTTGTYRWYLDLPDPSPSLTGSTPLAAGGGTVGAAYGIRLANIGTWEATQGWNDLGQTLSVARS